MIDSDEANTIDADDAKKLAIQRAKDAWKIDLGQLIVTEGGGFDSIGNLKTNVQICLLPDDDLDG